MRGWERPKPVPVPLDMTRTEGWWLAALWCFYEQTERRYRAFVADLFARYDTPEDRRFQAAATRESPLLRLFREQAQGGT